MGANRNQRVSAKRKLNSYPLPPFVASSTVTVMIMGIPEHPKATGLQRARIMNAAIASTQVPAGGGAITINLKVRDKSEAAVDTLVSAFDATTLTANVARDMAFAAETTEKERTLEAGDVLYAELVAASTVTTNFAANGASITVEYETMDQPGEGFGLPT